MRSMPCKGCKDRVLHCHSNCEKYDSYKEECELERQQRHEQFELVSFLYDSRRRVVYLGRTTRKHKTGGYNEN